MGYRSVFTKDLFAGRTVVITGGGSGIGRCTAHELAALGATVAIVGRNTAKLEAVHAEICSDGGRARIHSADIRDEAAVGRFVWLSTNNTTLPDFAEGCSLGSVRTATVGRGGANP